MATDVATITQGLPNRPDDELDAIVNRVKPTRITPRVHAGFFWLRDRRFYLPAKKTSCHLEDITWYRFQLADQPEVGSERVWVRGIEITGSDQYKFEGQFLLVNGGAFSHPNVYPGVRFRDPVLSPYQLGDVKNPTDTVQVDYNYPQWSAGTVAAGAGGLSNGVNGGFTIVPNRVGTWANSWSIIIPAATGNPAAWTTDVATQTITLTDWTTGSTTIAQAIAAFTDTNFTITHDGFGTSGDFVSDLITALGGAPQSETFSGGTDDGFTSSAASETQTLTQSEVEYKIPDWVRSGSPVVMTDDWMEDWDRRDISPEFTVAVDGTVEFNVPPELLWNSSFEGDPTTPIIWGVSAGTPVIEQESTMVDAGADPMFALPNAYSNSNYCRLDTTAGITQTVEIEGGQELYLSLRSRGAIDGTSVTYSDATVTVRFYDSTWTLLSTDTFTTAHSTRDWQLTERSYGPAGRDRAYDFNVPVTAAYMFITIAGPVTANSQIHIDYVSLVPGGLLPDHWQPHPLITVEYDLGGDYYTHQPNVLNNIIGEQVANDFELETCNVEAAFNSESSGFLNIHEYNDTEDHGLGLGGDDTYANGEPVSEPIAGSPTANDECYAVVSDGSGGWYVGGAFTTIGGVAKLRLAHILSNGDVDTAFSFDCDGDVDALSLQGDTLYVAGQFTTIDGQARGGLAKITLSTSTVETWNPTLPGGVTVRSMAVIGSNIYIGHDGAAASIGGVSRDYLNAVDTSTAAGVGAFDATITGSVVRTLTTYDGNLVVAGTFTACGGGARSGIAIVSPTTGTNSIGVPTPGTADVGAVAIYGDIMYFCGPFGTVDGSTRRQGAAYNLETSTLLDWEAYVTTFGAQTYDMHVDERNVILIGRFATAKGTPRECMAIISREGTGTLDAWFVNMALASTRSRLAVYDNTIAIATTSLFLGSSYTGGFHILKYYTGYAIQGRRHLPYYKMDGLGKLRHRSDLRYNAWPWTREVSYPTAIPVPGELNLIPSEHIIRRQVTGSIAVASSAGDTSVEMTAAAVSPVPGESFFNVSSGSVTDRAFDSILITAVAGPVFSLQRAFQYSHGTSACSFDYPCLQGYVGEVKFVRLKLLDQFGAPLGQQAISITESGTGDYEVLDYAEETNQDGEWWCLVRTLVATPAGPTSIIFSAGSASYTLRVFVQALP